MTDQHSSTTHLIHHPYQPPEGFAAPQVGVFKASTVYFPNVAAMREREWKDKSAYTYGLHGTPTTFTLEERIAALEGGTECVLVPSGLAAIAVTDLALLKTGDASGLAAIVIAKGLSVRDTEALSKDAKAGKAGAKDAAEEKDVDTKALELDLQRSLGLDVDIRHVNGKGGEVRIKYAQLEQLDEICRLLSRPRVASTSSARWIRPRSNAVA